MSDNFAETAREFNVFRQRIYDIQKEYFPIFKQIILELETGDFLGIELDSLEITLFQDVQLGQKISAASTSFSISQGGIDWRAYQEAMVLEQDYHVCIEGE